ncbi:MAG: acyl--CoA ligase [Sphingomonadales bacterium]|nr:acyl--CoA ligase [Sphingomonadales bacterium]
MTCGSALKQTAGCPGVSTKLVGIHDGLEVGAGEEGELLVKAASMSLGYANPADNQEAYDEDGYFRMGDLGRIVEGEYFVCTGRKKGSHHTGRRKHKRKRN